MRVITVLILLALLFSGCGNQPQNETTSPEANGHRVKVRQTAPDTKEMKSMNEISRHLEQIAEADPQVQSANCIIIGNTAIVGINVDGSLDRARVGTIKYSVAEAMRKDPYGANAIVTADPDLVERLREMREEMRRGRPVAGFAEELADIIGRIMPQLPKNTLPQNRQPAESEDSRKLHKDHL